MQVSEGINFADEHARAVILVGIPYPAFKDSKVEQKKAYNDHKDSQQRGLISGSRWYSLQAYRAMNQVGSYFLSSVLAFTFTSMVDWSILSCYLPEHLWRGESWTP